MTKATNRAEMPKGTNWVLDRRTVQNANKNLLDIVKVGDSVLDVGCGSGTIPYGIVQIVGEAGFVQGIDSSGHLIELAQTKFSDIKNLKFEVADIHTYHPDTVFDVVTSARVLQWLDNPQIALKKMYDLVKSGGVLTILDYNHTKIEWEPAIPDSMQTLYDAFLKWRQDAGMDNAIADHLPEMFEKLGLKNITVTDLLELSTPDSTDFEGDLEIWIKVAESRGKQLVADGYISETLRNDAINEYETWVKHAAKSMKMYLLAVTGIKV